MTNDKKVSQKDLSWLLSFATTARNTVIALENKADEVAEELQEEFKQLREDD